MYFKDSDLKTKDNDWRCIVFNNEIIEPARPLVEKRSNKKIYKPRKKVKNKENSKKIYDQDVDSIFDTKEKYVITEEQRTIYTTEGGYPSLDGEYTVFGELIEGLEVLDKIAIVETDKFNRPLSDVKMTIELEE